jgi:hypothetical protein
MLLEELFHASEFGRDFAVSIHQRVDAGGRLEISNDAAD